MSRPLPIRKCCRTTTPSCTAWPRRRRHPSTTTSTSGTWRLRLRRRGHCSRRHRRRHSRLPCSRWCSIRRRHSRWRCKRCCSTRRRRFRALSFRLLRFHTTSGCSCRRLRLCQYCLPTQQVRMLASHNFSRKSMFSFKISLSKFHYSPIISNLLLHA